MIPPTPHVRGKRVAVDITTLNGAALAQGNTAKPRLRFDKVATSSSGGALESTGNWARRPSEVSERTPYGDGIAHRHRPGELPDESIFRSSVDGNLLTVPTTTGRVRRARAALRLCRALPRLCCCQRVRKGQRPPHHPTASLCEGRSPSGHAARRRRLGHPGCRTSVCPALS